MTLTCDRVLVTGGAGFIGSHTVDALLENNVEVWVLDDLSTGKLLNLKRWKNYSRFHLKKGSVLDYKTVLTLSRRVDSIIHLAALVSPMVSIRRPELTNSVNVEGTINVLRAATKTRVQRLVYASSSSVYGESDRSKVSEDSPTHPITPYGVSKLSGESYCLAYYHTFGLETVALRYFNVYGERQSANQYSGVIAIFAARLLKGQRPVIYGDGTQRRDFIYVSDVAKANLLALETRRGIGKPFNIGTGHSTSVKELFEMLVDVTNKKNIQPLFRTRRQGDLLTSCADMSRASLILGFKPRIALRTGLNLLVATLRKSIRKG